MLCKEMAPSKRNRLLAMIRINKTVRYRGETKLGREQAGGGLREQIGATDENDIDKYVSIFAQGKAQ